MRGRRHSGAFSRFDGHPKARAGVAALLTATLAVTVLSALPANASTIPLLASLGKPVPGHAAAATPSPKATAPATTVHVSTLESQSYRVAIPRVAAPSLLKKAALAAPAGAWQKLGASGISVSQVASASASTPSVTGAQVAIVDPKVASQRHMKGLVLKINRTDKKPGSAPVAVRIPIALLNGLYGADYASRTQWVSVPAAGTTDAQVTKSNLVPETTDAASNSIVLTPKVSQAAVMLAAASTPTSATGTGSFTATSLKPASSWDVSAQTGDFSWQYPMSVPPAPAGPSPALSLSYDSQSIDGETGSTNNQPTTIGDGWNLAGSGFIERSYVSCNQDDGASGAVTASGDLCWKTDNATVNLAGHTGQLVKDAANGTWKLQSDDGSRIDHVTGTGSGCAANNSCDGDYWRMTTSNGTQYYFGMNKLPGWSSGKATTNSIWTVPVFGNDPGEPCHASTFATSSCLQPWRWNLDYVVDTNHNAEAFYFDAETNRYAKNGTGSTLYTRGGQIDHIDYGLTDSTVFATNAASDRVTFGYDANGRCSDASGKTCTKEPLTGAAVAPATAGAYPDVPFDQLCTSTTSCTSYASPTFWTDGMLDTVTTAVRSGTSYTNVDRWTLGHTFPAPGDGTNAALLMSNITHTGYAGAASLSEPATTFAYSALQNRAWVDGLKPLDKFRISSITASSGGVTSVTYDPQDCPVTTSAQRDAFVAAAAASTNTSRCYPQWWQPPVTSGVTTKARFDVFHKYVVKSVISDPKTGGAYDSAQEKDYVYTGTPAWKYDTSALTPKAQRTWSNFAGYNSVEVRVGNASTPSAQATTDYTFYQGLDGDASDTSGGTKSVSVTGAPGTPDSSWFGGFTRETKVLNGVGGSVLSDTVDTPWASSVEADDGTNTARYTGTSEELVSQPLASGGTRTIDTKTSYDNATGFATQVGKVTSDAGSTCQTTTYTPVSASAHIVGLPSEVATVGVACSNLSAASYPKDAISDVRTSYDGAAYGAAPTQGNATSVQTVDGYATSDPASAHWATTATTTYDSLGRPTSVTDVLGHTTSTAYTPASGGPLTQAVVTKTAPFAWTNTTVVNPANGNETSFTDEKGLTTTAAYDALGRRTNVWLPGRPQASNATAPSIAYAYTETPTAAMSVATTSITSNSTVTSYALFDGFGQPVQTQAPSEANGTVVTDTAYDSQGRVSSVDNSYWTTSVAPSTKLFVPTSQQQIPSMTSTSYDASGRTTATITSSLGNERFRTAFSYKGADEVDTTPPTGATPTTTFTNSLGQKTKLVQYLASTPSASATQEATSYSYDSSGRMTRMVDPSGNTWSWTFDVLGHAVATSDPDTGISSSQYDDAGDLLASTDARGQSLSYTYDSLGRKTAEYDGSTSGSLLDSWTYDSLAKGEPTSSSSYTGSTPQNPGAAYTTTISGYDTAGRPTGSTVSIPAGAPAFAGTNYKTSLVYNQDGSLASETDPGIGGLDAERVTYGYDSFGNVSSVYGATVYASIIRTALGQVAQINRDGKVVDYSTYSYDPATSAVLGISDQTGTGTSTVQQLNRAYTRDNSGNVTSVNETGAAGAETQCYSYDQLQEITEAWTPASPSCSTVATSATLGGPAPYWNSYTYDPATGNRLSSTEHNTGTGSDKVDTYQYPAATTANPHAVQSVSSTQAGSTTTASYGYDAIGDTVSRPGQTLTYTPEDRISTLTTSAGTESNVYGADGSLLLETDPTAGATLYLGDTELHQAPGSSTVTATRTYSIAGTAVDERSTDSGTNTVWSLNTDVDGTADLEENVTTGATTRRYVDPFGNARGAPPTWTSNHGFLNAPTSTFSGLTQLGAREYDSTLGKFLSVDPVLATDNPLQNNGYAYAANSPISNTDATGQCYVGSSDSLSGQINCGGGHGSTTPTQTSVPPQKPPRPKPAGNTSNDYTAPNPGAGGSCSYGYSFESCTSSHTVAVAKPNPKAALITLNIVTGLFTVGVIVCTIATVGACAAIGGEADAALISTVVTEDTVAAAGESTLEVGVEGAAEGGGEGLEGGEAEDGAASKTGCSANSFTADTPVLLASGATVPISTVALGDKVLATDTTTGKTSGKTVEKLWLNHDDDLMDVTVKTSSGSSVIHATQHHLFWDSTRKAWIEADRLQPGEELLPTTGSAVTVAGTKLVPGAHDMWDLTVAGDHDFYVAAAASTVLVHNCDAPEFTSDAGHIFRNAKGHIEEDTPSNRALIQDAIRPQNLVRSWPNGQGGKMSYYTQLQEDGSQVWAEVRDGETIENAGVNKVPR